MRVGRGGLACLPNGHICHIEDSSSPFSMQKGAAFNECMGVKVQAPWMPGSAFILYAHQARSVPRCDAPIAKLQC